VRRRLFNLAAAVSLVLCVATAAVWARSIWVFDHVAFVVGGRSFLVRTRVRAIRLR
jgi:hypothetical protein